MILNLDNQISLLFKKIILIKENCVCSSSPMLKNGNSFWTSFKTTIISWFKGTLKIKQP